MSPELGYILMGVFALASLAIAVDWIFVNPLTPTETLTESAPATKAVEDTPVVEHLQTATVIPLRQPAELARAA